MALLAYAAMIAFYFSVAAGGSDSSGYFNSARLFSQGEVRTTLRVPAELGPPEKQNPMHFLPLGFWPILGSANINPTYPPGLPLHMAVAAKVFGWTVGPIVLGVLSAIAAVWLMYAVARELGLGWKLAAAGATVLAFCPVFLFSAVQPLSDGLATTWCLAAMWAALRSRRDRRWALAVGVAYAIAVLVRPTNILLAPALVVVLGADWRRLVLFGLGGLPGAIAQAGYNQLLYGGALRSGYGSIFETFHFYWLKPTAWHFLKWLSAFLPAVLLLLPFAALSRPASRTRELLALGLWFGAIVGTYLFYEVSHEVWWCLRFILPAVPALIVGGLLGYEALLSRRPPANAERLRGVAALVLGLWAALLGRGWTRELFVMNVKDDEHTYIDAPAAVEKLFPPDTLIVTMTFSGTFYFYGNHPVLRWDQVEAPEFARMAAIAHKAGRTICAIEYKWEEQKALRDHCPGKWTKVATLNNAMIWRLTPSAAPAAQ